MREEEHRRVSVYQYSEQMFVWRRVRYLFTKVLIAESKGVNFASFERKGKFFEPLWLSKRRVVSFITALSDPFTSSKHNKTISIQKVLMELDVFYNKMSRLEFNWMSCISKRYHYTYLVFFLPYKIFLNWGMQF